MKKILEERIYQQDKLDKVYEDMINENPKLNIKKLKDIWEEILNDLNE